MGIACAGPVDSAGRGRWGAGGGGEGGRGGTGGGGWTDGVAGGSCRAKNSVGECVRNFSGMRCGSGIKSVPEKENRTEGGRPLAGRGRRFGHALPAAVMAAAGLVVAAIAAGEAGIVGTAARSIAAPGPRSRAPRSGWRGTWVIQSIVKDWSSMAVWGALAARGVFGRASGARVVLADGMVCGMGSRARFSVLASTRGSGLAAGVCILCVPILVFFITSRSRKPPLQHVPPGFQSGPRVRPNKKVNDDTKKGARNQRKNKGLGRGRVDRGSARIPNLDEI